MRSLVAALAILIGLSGPALPQSAAGGGAGGGGGGGGGPATQSGTWNVGLTGTLPAFAAVPTFNLGTLNGASTAANQTSEIAAIQALGTGISLAGSTNIIGRVSAGTAYTESATALGASGTITGAARNTGYGQTSPTAFSYFTAQVFADQGGTLFVEQSADGTNFFPVNGASGTAVAANASVIVKSPATTNLFRVRYTNGATAQTKFFLTSMFSVN